MLALLGSFVAVADGLAMLLPGPSSKLGGVVLVAVGLFWWSYGGRRLLLDERRPYWTATIAAYGAVWLPILCLPIAGLWLAATPAALTVWFGVSWGTLWVAARAAAAFVPCPSCDRPFSRDGLSLPRGVRCAHCGTNAFSTAHGG